MDHVDHWITAKGQAMALDTNKPIRIFYANMLRIGIKMRVVDGQLKVRDTTGIMTPVLQDEIIKRAEQLTDLLAPEVPEQLEKYFYRLINVDELKEAIYIAEVMGLSLRGTPVNGGWLIEIVTHRASKGAKV